MAEDEPERAQSPPSLELPSLGGWRRNRRGNRSAAQPVEEPLEGPGEQAGGALSTVTEPEPAQEPEAVTTPEPELEPAPETAEQPALSGGARKIPLRARRPGGFPTVVVVGLLVGLAVVGLTWASLQTCEQVQGTPSCGTAGYPMLALVLVVSVLVGGVLLRLTRVPDPVSTSFLGVGLAAVLVLLLLVDRLEEPAMVVVIPVLSALTFAAAHWVTTTFIEPGDRDR